MRQKADIFVRAMSGVLDSERIAVHAVAEHGRNLSIREAVRSRVLGILRYELTRFAGFPVQEAADETPAPASIQDLQ